jgi:hypothetical protein
MLGFPEDHTAEDWARLGEDPELLERLERLMLARKLENSEVGF